MDLYTTSFTYHRPAPRSIRPSSSPLPSSLALPGSGNIPTIPLPNVTSATTPAGKTSLTANLTTAAQVEKDWNDVQSMCLDITTREGCLVTVTKESIGADLSTSTNDSNGASQADPNAPIPSTTTWNFHLSGGYQSVMSARGAILRETPKDNKTVLKVSRTEILESPLSNLSPLKVDVKRRLDEIALDSKAHIAVLNIEIPGAGVGGTVLATADGQSASQPSGNDNEAHPATTTTDSQREGSAGPDSVNGANVAPDLLQQPRKASSEASATAPTVPAPAPAPPPNAPVTYGLETERMCELVITGPLESVEVAKVRLLVMLDELSGLHSEVCDIDYKLHNIIASRKRGVIQSIQEETATNIYYPTPLVGVLNPPQPGQQQEQGKLGKANQIWITGEFFGVQRARDMLLNVAVQKSKLVISRDTAILPRKLDWLLTERLEEVKGVMNDNGTYIQVPSVGSQASLITVFGDHRVNIERTIRSIMGLACQFYVASFWLLPISFDVLMPQATLNPAQMQPILKRIAHATGAEVVFKSNCFEMHGLEQEVRAAVMMVLELEAIHNFHHEVRFQIELANEHREFISGKKNGKINKIMKMAGVKIKFETFNDYNFLMDISGSDLGSLQGLSMLQEELPAEVSFHVPESYHKRIIGVGGKNIQRIMKLYGVYVKFSNAEEFAALGGYIDNEDNVVARTPAKNAINLESLKQSVMELVNPKDKDYTVESVSIPRRYHRTLLGEKSIFIHDIEQKTNSIVRFPYKESASDIVTIFGPESQVHIAAAMLLDHVPFEADLHVPPNPELTRLVTSSEFILFTERVKRDHQIAIVPSAKFGQGDEAIFKFRCQRSNIDFLGTARDALEEWLGQHNIQVYPSNATKRVDSFADAFTHFNSKLLATGANNNEAEGESLVERRQRPVTVSTDVRALFNGPGGAYRSAEESALGFAGPLSYQNPPRGSDLWPGSTQPTRTESDHSKRDSDPIIQDRVRQASTGHSNTSSHPSHPHPHSQSRINPTMRHQSLDISHMKFSRSSSTSGGANVFGPMPPSPTAANSSPNTATGPYFPHVGPHPIRANVTGRGAYSAMSGAASTASDQGVESVTQG
uniref:Cytoplasmic protein n=1 Tax=Kwoniella dejecticola CBS 10117 TaxID=1296121 RepID=A0A1A5ZVG8_9TREE|nr:cytoplasmic protein [Kwoniella dejecticola CBS 10117]OBR81798.1 cytoplasmic protein [Kwoniella dejecticola CBS 10117]